MIVLKLIDGSESWYMAWSTVCDAPLTYGLTLKELQEYIRQEHGAAGYLTEENLKHLEAKGTSSWRHRSADSVIAGNYAGNDGIELSMAEIIQKYCREKSIRRRERDGKTDNPRLRTATELQEDAERKARESATYAMLVSAIDNAHSNNLDHIKTGCQIDKAMARVFVKAGYTVLRTNNGSDVISWDPS